MKVFSRQLIEFMLILPATYCLIDSLHQPAVVQTDDFCDWKASGYLRSTIQ